MTLVIDASVAVAALVDAGQDGMWAGELLSSNDLIGPHLLPVEAANVIRLAELAGDIAPELASLAYGDLLALRVEMLPYEPFAARVWDLRHSVTAYDAWYVAIAELFDLSLATLDRRLARAAGPRCHFVTP